MSLPKTFHQKTNLPNIYKSLNKLNFYRFTFNITVTKNFYTLLENDEDFGTGLNILDELGVLMSETSNENIKICEKTISALSEEVANRKINEWLDKFLDNTVISDYVVLSKKELSFEDILEEKQLKNIFRYEN
jgi:phosphoribosylformylglycinamidine (FGAM) synthase PurS component